MGREEIDPEVVDAGLSPEDMTRLHEALALVPPEYATVMWEVSGHGAKIADLAAGMGLEADALRQKLCRFRRDIREALDS